MTVAERFRPTAIGPVQPTQPFYFNGAAPTECPERFRLREEYIRLLAEFNQAAARHKMVVSAGMDTRKSWQAFQDATLASRAAWARYRKHLATHACKRANSLAVAA